MYVCMYVCIYISTHPNLCVGSRRISFRLRPLRRLQPPLQRSYIYIEREIKI